MLTASCSTWLGVRHREDAQGENVFLLAGFPRIVPIWITFRGVLHHFGVERVSVLPSQDRRGSTSYQMVVPVGLAEIKSAQENCPRTRREATEMENPRAHVA